MQLWYQFCSSEVAILFSPNCTFSQDICSRDHNPGTFFTTSLSQSPHFGSTANVIFQVFRVEIRGPKEGPTHTSPAKFDYNAFSLWTRRLQANVLYPHHAGGIWKRPDHCRVILDLCLRKSPSDKSHEYHDVIVFEKLRIPSVFGPH